MLDVGPLKCLHYDKPIYWETDAFMAIGVEPNEVIAAVQAYQPGPHLLGVYTLEPESVIAMYTLLGYKTVPTEPMEVVMAKSLKSLKLLPLSYPVRRVETLADVDLFNAELGHERMHPDHLQDPMLSYYYVPLDGKAVCQGRTFSPSSAAIHVAGLFTHPDYRRRGLATALMNRIHADAADAGAFDSVLVAMPMGISLYKRLGYEVLTYVHKFVPKDWN